MARVVINIDGNVVNVDCNTLEQALEAFNLVARGKFPKAQSQAINIRVPFTIVSDKNGPFKIRAIKRLRDFSPMSLGDAKRTVEAGSIVLAAEDVHQFTDYMQGVLEVHVDAILSSSEPVQASADNSIHRITFTINSDVHGPLKLRAIKAVREFGGYSLLEAKNIVEQGSFTGSKDSVKAFMKFMGDHVILESAVPASL
jgi:ribosomal protein L7/L12